MLLLDSLDLFTYPTAIIMKKPSFYIKRLFLIAFLLMTLSTQANTQLASTTLGPTIETLHCDSDNISCQQKKIAPEQHSSIQPQIHLPQENRNIFEAAITVSLISTVVLLSQNLLFMVVL